MRTSQAVFLTIASNKNWGKEALALFAKAPAEAQANIISAASLSTLEFTHFINDRAVSQELVFFCEDKGIEPAAFLEQILEYQKLLAPTDTTRLCLELDAAVALLGELNLEIDKKRSELQMLKQAINATKKEKNHLFSVFEREGTISIVQAAIAMDMLPTEAIARMVKLPEDVKTDWFDDLPKALTAENARTAWASLPAHELLGKMKEAAFSNEGNHQVMFAAAVALYGEHMTDELMERHIELIGNEGYADAYQQLERAYAKL